MSRTATLAFLLLTTTLAAAGPVGQAPIIGGTPTKVGDYPSVVVLEIGPYLCTGTLITKDWVLTAAHCVQGFAPASIKVHFNTVSLFSSPGEIVGASMAIAKPSFSQNNLGVNDIGLIKLATPVTKYHPVPVNLDPTKVPLGTKVTMVGFGQTSGNPNSGAGTQFVVQQTSVGCSAYGYTDSNLLCFSQTSGTGKCEGDSGGPSFAQIDGVMTQVGVTSFGDQYCEQFGADTRTDAEKDWLLQYVPELLCEYDSDCGDGSRCFNKRCILAPFTTGGVGSECAQATECESNVCASDGNDSYCSFSCNPGMDNACPDGLDCLDTGDGVTGACWPSDGGGCCSATGADAATGVLGFLFLGFVFSRRRRR